MSKWTVWVGAYEVNWQHYAYKIDAERVAEFYREVKGYDDVIVEEIARAIANLRRANSALSQLFGFEEEDSE